MTLFSMEEETMTKPQFKVDRDDQATRNSVRMLETWEGEG